MSKRWVVVACVLMAGCATPGPAPDTARLAPGQLGTGMDPDVSAMNQAQWAFADPGRTRGRPIEAARAAASMDYVAGQFSTSPRWSNVDALTKQQLLQGRVEVRRALDVAPGAPSQAVVERLIAVANALLRDDQRAALQALDAPVFTAPPAQVLARLENMPYLRMANVSTMRAAQELFPEGELLVP